MLIEEVLKHPTELITEDQRQLYFENGCVRLEGLISVDWIERLRAASFEMIERSRTVAKNDKIFVLEKGHSCETPRLKRVTSPVSHHEEFWHFASTSKIVEVVSDVVGPNVRFHHSKLNYMWADGGQRFDWHQDIQAWPHTNYSPVTVVLLMEDVEMDQGPLVAIKGSHTGPLYNLYDERDNFVIRIDDTELNWITEDVKEYMVGAAGTVFLLNCRTIHGSTTNHSSRKRPLLLNVYSSADAFPYGANPIPSKFDGVIVKGVPARWSHHDPRPCQVPPDWSQGYTGPWDHQKRKTS